MNERQTQVRYEELDDGQVVFEIVGANGEVQTRSERYDSISNARRGAQDLLRTMVELAANGKLGEWEEPSQ